ncbi:MAG: IclR family transcriptional regulator [Actinobacteria bacterium]|jgi:DNA-binding IclR family transcriptional regulator|nr:IclR family transcriptional regulator [Micrococcales bacterium]MCB9428166.1 IclR family transcriptional regulator [Actinomycetota bacterium]HPE10887.1 IclR family transcriptional regulator [Actinomycetota bacterium]HPQ83427.1 IclR family transcriptional regulator [Actinomycetota bacterium]HRV65215.1 IclR family transcriptional regulator [Candidatus Nanopelagicales bacterium]
MEKANTVGTLVKAGAILDALEVGPQDLNDLSVLTGQPRATCHRLASALVGLRWVDKDDSGRYTIGPRLHELSAASSGDRLRTVALPTLRRLRDDTGESAQIYRRKGNRRLCVASVEPATGLRDTVPEGAVLTMSAGSAAQVLAAWSDGPSAFDAKALNAVRNRGWADSVAERESGVASVSAPVLSGGRVIAAVSISGPIDRLTKRPGQRFGTRVRAAAAEVERELDA